MEFCNIERLLPKLESRKAIPLFELSSNKGKTINLWDFKQLKNYLSFSIMAVNVGFAEVNYEK